MLRKFCLALTFLTIIPCGTRFFTGRFELASSAPYFPLVGAVLGLLMGGTAYLLQPFLPPGPLVGLIFIMAFFLTRGLHLDGLADTADGLVGGFDKERSLEIMRDSVVGAMGVCAIVFVYIFKYGALTAVEGSFFPLAVFALPFCGRWAMVLAGAFFGPARQEGLGNKFIAELGWPHFLKASLAGAAVLVVLFFWDNLFILPLLWGIGAAFLASLLFAAFAVRRLGGLTGDLLGAVNEIAEAVFLLGLLLLLP